MIRYILPYENITTGGAELLMGMISKYIKVNQEDDEVTILCKTIDDGMENYFYQNLVSINRVKKWSEARKKIKNYDDSDEVRVIVLLWEDLIWFSSINKKNIKVILWVAHFSGLRIGETCRYRVAKYIIKKMASRCINSLLETGNIVCLEDMTVSSTADYFGKMLDCSKLKIFRAPMEKILVDEKDIKRRAESYRMNILTISRADFPYKGYLLGLVDFADELDKRGDDFHLTIISYGDGIEILKEKISKCRKTVCDKISLIGKTDYADLEKYYPDTKLYIGMDTTVAEAAQRGIVSIPVMAYTYELSANSFYHEHTNGFAKAEDKENIIWILYDKVKNMSTEEYYILSKKSCANVERHFSLEKNTSEFLKLFVNAKKNAFNFRIICFYFLYKIILSLRKEK